MCILRKVWCACSCSDAGNFSETANRDEIHPHHPPRHLGKCVLDLCLRRFILIRDVSLCEHRRQYIFPRFFEISACNQEFSDLILSEVQRKFHTPKFFYFLFSLEVCVFESIFFRPLLAALVDWKYTYILDF